MKTRRFGVRSGHDETEVGTSKIRINISMFLPEFAKFSAGSREPPVQRVKFRPRKWTTRSMLRLNNFAKSRKFRVTSKIARNFLTPRYGSKIVEVTVK